jgi:hypothetical protein
MGLDLGQARRQAKELLHAAKSGDSAALARFRSDRPPCLADAQAAVARELGFRSWAAFRAARFKSERNQQLLAVPIGSRGVRQGTALHYAALWGRSGTLAHLLARGADVSARAEPPDSPGPKQWSALDWAAWGSQHAVDASSRSSAYRECAAMLLEAGAVITERAPVAHLIDEIRESGRAYVPGRPIRVRVRVRGTRVDVDDMGGAVAAGGMPTGWREAAERVVTDLGWNMRRNGVVFMQAPHGRKLAWIIECTAQASAAVFDALLMLSAEAQPEPRRARRRPLPPR